MATHWAVPEASQAAAAEAVAAVGQHAVEEQGAAQGAVQLRQARAGGGVPVGTCGSRGFLRRRVVRVTPGRGVAVGACGSRGFLRRLVMRVTPGRGVAVGARGGSCGRRLGGLVRSSRLRGGMAVGTPCGDGGWVGRRPLSRRVAVGRCRGCGGWTGRLVLSLCQC